MIKKVVLLVLLPSAAQVSAHDDLTEKQLKMLRDSGGWEYITMSDADNGMQTTHTCFDGKPHPDVCSGTLTLNEDGTFVQQVFVHHESVQRHGKYQLDGDQLAFFDEYENKDGPYTIELDADTKSLTMKMPQVRVELELAKEYKRATAPLQ